MAESIRRLLRRAAPVKLVIVMHRVLARRTSSRSNVGRDHQSETQGGKEERSMVLCITATRSLWWPNPGSPSKFFDARGLGENITGPTSWSYTQPVAFESPSLPNCKPLQITRA